MSNGIDFKKIALENRDLLNAALAREAEVGRLYDSLVHSSNRERGASYKREAALREELAGANRRLGACINQIEEQQQRLAVAEQEAKRYRWLREGAVMHYVSAEGSEGKDAYLTVTGYGYDDSPDVIDSAIDNQIYAALKPAAEGEGS